MKLSLPLLTGILLMAAGCKKAANAPADDSREWKYFVAHPDFIIELPANWKYVKPDDEHAYTGLFTNERDSIAFDYGSNTSRFFSDSTHTVISSETIDNRKAVIAIGTAAPYNKGMYIDSVSGHGSSRKALSIYQVSNPEIANAKALHIFKSVKFN